MARATKPHIGNPRQWLKDEIEPTSNITFTRVHPAQEFEIDVRVGWGGSGGDRAQHVRVRLSDTEIAQLVRFALDRGIEPSEVASGGDRYVEL